MIQVSSIYRGQEDNRWDVDCAIARRVRENINIGTDVTFEVVLFFQKESLKRIKEKNFAEYRNYLDIEIIAHQQHLGSATLLVDFTRNALVALYFACQASKGIEHGAVYVVNMNDADFENFNDIKYSDYFRKESNIDPHKLYYYDPGNLVSRTDSQSSILILGAARMNPSIYTKINVWGASKKEILDELDSIYNISESKIFNDPYGYAKKNNSSAKVGLDSLPQRLKESMFDLESIKLNAFLSNFPKDGSWHKTKGFLYYRIGDWHKAIEHYSEAINKGKIDANIYNNLANVKTKVNDYPGAIEDYSKAIDINDEFAEAYSNRGIAWKALGKYKKSLEDYNKAIEINPRYTPAYNNRGIVKAKLGDNKGALDDFSEAITQRKDYLLPYINRSDLYLNMSKPEDALSDFLCIL